MGSTTSILGDLRYARSRLLKSIQGLSHRELTGISIYEGWTIKDILAHIIGWDQRTLKILPLMLQNRAGEIRRVEVEDYNRQSVNAWRDKSLAQVLAEAEILHQQILDILASTGLVEIEMRRQRHEQIITIRSYVIDVMIEHEQQHAIEIEQWRKNLEQTIDPEAIKETLAKNRTSFWTALAGLSEADLLDETAVGNWSVKDVVGHIADWEQRMLNAARHIHDPSRPEVPPMSDNLDDWNSLMAARRKANTCQENFRHLRETQALLDKFVAQLKPGDWKLRGPYPWPGDQGTLAELLSHIAEHYADHLPDLARWRRERGHVDC